MLNRAYPQRTGGLLWDRANRTLWRNLVANMGFFYWVVFGWWLVPMAYLTLWASFGLYGSTVVAKQMWLVFRPSLVRRGLLSPLPRRDVFDTKYPWLRVQSENPQVTYDRALSARQLRAGPRSGPIRDWQDAEERAAEWMRHWGWLDASVTESGADGGIDVSASGAVAQVKFWEKAVPRPDLQNLVGAASTRGDVKHMLFFSRNGYTSDARGWADLAGVATFAFDEAGNPQPQNNLAAQIAAGKTGIR